jgi:osmotically-inducible protein OsmY
MIRTNAARAAVALLSFAAAAVFAQAQVVPPAASGSISGMYSGTNAANPAPSGIRKGTGDVTDNRGSTSFGEARISQDDGQLLGAIIAALAADPALRGAELQVEVDQGVVGITGTAENAAQAERARRVAAQAARGATVESDIEAQ